MRLIDADALLKHEIEADRMGAMLVVGKGYILDAPIIDVMRGEWEINGYCSECRGRAQPENEPLTLGELRGMDGEPVWMARAKKWVFVSTVVTEPYAQVWYFFKGFVYTVLYYHEKFYRNKPERSEE